MKKYLEILVTVVICLIAGAYMHKCQTPKEVAPPGDKTTGTVKTETFIDTIPYYLPETKQEVSIGPRVVYLPVFQNKTEKTEEIEATIVLTELRNDSVAVEIPISQREYEGEEYHAWVSGYDPKLDSIFVFPRHEIVTIRDPPDKPKRWGIGVFAGYGYTPSGFQPCVGISINYNIWNF